MPTSVTFSLDFKQAQLTIELGNGDGTSLGRLSRWRSNLIRRVYGENYKGARLSKSAEKTKYARLAV